MRRQLISVLAVVVLLVLCREAQGRQCNEKLGKLEQNMENLQSRQDKEGAIVDMLVRRVNILEKFHDLSGEQKKISFLVRLSGSISPRANSVIRFPRVIQNLGNAYSPSTGKFTSPVSGIYLFHVSAVAKAQIQVDLIMDGTLLVTAWGWSGSGDFQGSNMAVVHMRRGQRVWARFMRGNQRVLHYGYTQFTGTLLRQD